jgi:hypothetical protein
VVLVEPGPYQINPCNTRAEGDACNGVEMEGGSVVRPAAGGGGSRIRRTAGAGRCIGGFCCEFVFFVLFSVFNLSVVLVK